MNMKSFWKSIHRGPVPIFLRLPKNTMAGACFRARLQPGEAGRTEL